jgi:hypothetical protein
MMKTTWWYEVSVSKNGISGDGKVRGLYGKGGKVHWVQKGQPRASFAEAQADAIANGERPYRIKSRTIDEALKPVVATEEAA